MRDDRQSIEALVRPILERLLFEPWGPRTRGHLVEAVRSALESAGYREVDVEASVDADRLRVDILYVDALAARHSWHTELHTG